MAVFIVENALVAFRFLLAAAIPDYPSWIEKEMFSMENRVKQVAQQIEDKVIIKKIREEKPVEFVDQVIHELHNDRDLASLLIPKIKQGCVEFLKLYENLELAKDTKDENALNSLEKKMKKKGLPFSTVEMHKKLKALRHRIEML